ncbi:MAG: hypothetical protein ACOC3V_01825 [bacterium]
MDKYNIGNVLLDKLLTIVIILILVVLLYVIIIKVKNMLANSHLKYNARILKDEIKKLKIQLEELKNQKRTLISEDIKKVFDSRYGEGALEEFYDSTFVKYNCYSFYVVDIYPDNSRFDKYIFRLKYSNSSENMPESEFMNLLNQGKIRKLKSTSLGNRILS